MFSNNKILFIDDEKTPDWYGLPEDTVVAKSYDDAISKLSDEPMILYLDHDLGRSKDGSKILDYIVNNKWIPVFVYITSFNSVGIDRIKYVCEDYDIPYEIKRPTIKIDIIDGQSG